VELKITIDASAALKWQFRDETNIEDAVNMLLDYEESKVYFIVPRLFYYEIANAIYIAVQRGRITDDVGKSIINDMLAIEAEVIDSLELLKTAYLNAKKYGISVYDSIYLTLADEHGVLLYTGDRKFYNTIKDKKRFIRWIGDYRRKG
jgi:predicted nucleic acid-binding protein